MSLATLLASFRACTSSKKFTSNILLTDQLHHSSPEQQRARGDQVPAGSSGDDHAPWTGLYRRTRAGRTAVTSKFRRLSSRTWRTQTCNQCESMSMQPQGIPWNAAGSEVSQASRTALAPRSPVWAFCVVSNRSIVLGCCHAKGTSRQRACVTPLGVDASVLVVPRQARLVSRGVACFPTDPTTYPEEVYPCSPSFAHDTLHHRCPFAHWMS